MKPMVSLLAATLALAACAPNNVRVGAPSYTQLYYPQLVDYVTQGGQLATVIRGNPFGPGPVDAEAIAAALPLPNTATPFRYRVMMPEAARKSARVVLIFGPATDGPGDSETCNNPQDEAIRPGGGPIGVRAVFCVGPSWTTTLFASSPAASGPTDPQFQSLMNQVIAGILPQDQPLTDHGLGGGTGFQ